MPLTLLDFVRKWNASHLTERAAAQQHFRDLCEALEVPHPTQADEIGASYTYEKHVRKAGTGEPGYADVWKRGFFAWEYKSKGGDLKRALKQLNEYHGALDNPPLLVVCDFVRFEIHTKFENAPTRVFAFTLDDLLRPVDTPTCALPPAEVLRACFLDFNPLRPNNTAVRVTRAAAADLLRLATRLELESRPSPLSREQIAHFLMRIVFCLFADSIGLLPEHTFRNLVLSDDRFLPTRFRRKLRILFEAMSEPDGIFGPHTIRYFNGGLFTDDTVIELDKADLGILASAASHDWSHIEPTIFGTLFERSLDAGKRSLIGAHYTSTEDILLLIEPVVMAPLHRRWQTVRAEAEAALAAESSPSPLLSSPTPSPLLSSRSEAEGSAFPNPPIPPGAPPSPTVSPLAKVGSTKAQPPSTIPQPTLKLDRPALHLLTAWTAELARVTVLDPACGSGNFLYVALRRLLDLWFEAQTFAIRHNLALLLDPIPSPHQLFGIETDFYAHEIASVVVWIGFLQWKHEHAIVSTKEPLLQKLDNIQHDDAILRYDAEGHPYEPAWPSADFIVGNPPFLGGKLLRRELGDRYIDDLFRLYAGRVRAESDLVVYWFEKARAHLEAGQVARVGLLATQGIRGGANRAVLERIARTGNIFWAWSDRNWLLNGANVHISLIAFDRGTKEPASSPTHEQGAPSSPTVSPSAKGGSTPPKPGAPSFPVSSARVGSAPDLSANGATAYQPGAQPQVSVPKETKGLKARHIASARASFLNDPETAPFLLNGEPVPAIHPDLTFGTNTTSARRLPENRGICFMGTTKVGPFDIDAETARKMLAAPLNPNDRPNADVVRPWVNATDITRRPRGMYIIDFGTTMSQREAALYEMPFEYVKHHVLPERKVENRDLGDKPWWLHGRSRPELRAAVNGSPRFIATPGVSKHRIFVWLPARTLPDHAAFAFTRPDDYFFGVLHSRAHEIWARAQGTQLREVESGFRYTPDSTFDTFPFPWPPPDEPTSGPSLAQKEAIAEAARHLVHLRDNWLNPPNTPEADLKKRTLTNLYNARPTWLAAAHRLLDEAVFAAYGWPPTLSTPEILTRLLALNHARAAAQPANPPKPRPRQKLPSPSPAEATPPPA